MTTAGASSVALLTCSMARDLDLFALLARSVDDHVDPAIPHRVIVPGAELAAFKPYATPRREIIAQEDVLPVKLWKAPRALRHLAFIKAGFRRPLYLAPGFKPVRGWMLQQLLKIDLARSAPEAAVMHVDSDVAFFRRFSADQAFAGGKPRFFRALGKTRNPWHRPWVEASCAMLGVAAPAEHDAHYIENCVLWGTDVTRRMAARIEEQSGKPLHEAIFAERTMSEYYLYGVFADLLGGADGLMPEEVSFCNSYWPDDETGPVDFDALKARLQPKHVAMAVQSTHQLTAQDRAALYRRADTEFPDTGAGS
ncbi:MAG: hypothetical protein HLUCCA08_00415 [Rhodobacteraceae bacterium HLUCCA08]|nr:MAG: hypothetical protein HLUCCA08_00415 [Rhodobacteraceae bacterium HLUCCA08]